MPFEKALISDFYDRGFIKAQHETKHFLGLKLLLLIKISALPLMPKSFSNSVNIHLFTSSA